MDAVLAAVIFERFGVIPVYIRDVYPALQYPPAAVRRGCDFEVVSVKSEVCVSIVDTCIICRSVLILCVYAFRKSFELHLLDLSVISESPVVIPSYA